MLTTIAPRFTRFADNWDRMRLVLLASGAYAAAFALVVWQALCGQPLIHPDGAAPSVTVLIVVAVTLGTYVSLRTFASSSEPAIDAEGAPSPASERLAA
ncbi:hypothetical protein OG963_43900 (plasmid) [Streptomyces sp. NBC_01707]|uniref:hypothetical protein n=1 Tax=Streptomyces sp. NBC_01707 TaxID=2975914 RepID=UPI00352C3E7F